MKEAFRQRFEELTAAYQQIQWKDSQMGRYAAGGTSQRWGTSAQNLIRAVFGVGSPHYENFEKAFAHGSHTSSREVAACFGIFQSAKDDFEGGYVFDLDKRISGELLGDFVGMAKQSLMDGYKDVAAVLACAALEDSLKRYARLNDLNVDGKSMQEVINALKSKRLVDGPLKSLLDSMPPLRNAVMHAEWQKVTNESTGALIGFVEQFLMTKFA